MSGRSEWLLTSFSYHTVCKEGVFYKIMAVLVPSNRSVSLPGCTEELPVCSFIVLYLLYHKIII